MNYSKPEVTKLASAFGAIQHPNVKALHSILDLFPIFFTTTSPNGYAADE